MCTSSLLHTAQFSPFPEWCVDGITQYVTLSDWFLSHGIVCLKFLLLRDFCFNLLACVFIIYLEKYSIVRINQFISVLKNTSAASEFWAMSKAPIASAAEPFVAQVVWH